ncbi:LysR family transcriptional regulator [Paenibacillus hemerocallicola]|uniref:LysR family transcriptional regulator n=1 Tax=Paenibacillus hemerocallicola TaxID=1172614 RepID=A0A5C4T403_9BACL|nr:LysR family transcriptional regulator [Paenibacillus hemerocallicola]TNJ63495.1 LysR family transcriptional regulator [Paenibacillus hemerocallicola]
MDFMLMKTFKETARLMNITRAADSLGYAQSSVTAQIRKLEQHYGVPLFERSGRGIRLTPGGRQLLEFAERFLDLAEESMQAVSAETAGSITIGTIESMAAFYLPPYVREMKEKFPSTGLLLQTANEAELLHGVRTGEYDAGIWLERDIADPELVRVILKEEPLLLVARPDHPLAGAQTVQLADFAGHAWVAPERSCSYRSMLSELLAEHGIRPQLSCELGSVEAIKRCVLHGLGMSLLPGCAVASEIRDGRLTVLPFAHPRLRIYVQLVYPAGRWVSRTLAAFMSMLRQPAQSE